MQLGLFASSPAAPAPAAAAPPAFRFFLGLHHPPDAARFPSAFVSVNRLRERRSAFPARDWIMDSGAFTEISTHGGYRATVGEYAAQVRRWRGNGNMLAAVAQDWMCEAHILRKTGLTVEEHQRRTVERYRALLDEDAGAYIMPVIQGWLASDYTRHLEMYGDLLPQGAWVGVGSVCRRNSEPLSILRVLHWIEHFRPDLRLHGFGVKLTAIACPFIRERLASADSMAWSLNARREGRGGNDWRDAAAFADRVEALCR